MYSNNQDMRFENNWSLLGLCALLGPKAGGVDMALLSLVFLLVAIFLGFFRKMNTGLVCIAFALVLEIFISKPMAMEL